VAYLFKRTVYYVKFYVAGKQKGQEIAEQSGLWPFQPFREGALTIVDPVHRFLLACGMLT
jgi:hypothetical protein